MKYRQKQKMKKIRSETRQSHLISRAALAHKREMRKQMAETHDEQMSSIKHKREPEPYEGSRPISHDMMRTGNVDE